MNAYFRLLQHAPAGPTIGAYVWGGHIRRPHKENIQNTRRRDNMTKDI